MFLFGCNWTTIGNPVQDLTNINIKAKCELTAKTIDTGYNYCFRVHCESTFFLRFKMLSV